MAKIENEIIIDLCLINPINCTLPGHPENVNVVIKVV